MMEELILFGTFFLVNFNSLDQSVKGEWPPLER